MKGYVLSVKRLNMACSPRKSTKVPCIGLEELPPEGIQASILTSKNLRSCSAKMVKLGTAKYHRNCSKRLALKRACTVVEVPYHYVNLHPVRFCASDTQIRCRSICMVRV